jgi:hypothetical protein
MRRNGSGWRSVFVFALLAFSSATLSATSARAEPPDPPPAQPKRIELRVVFFGGPHGEMRHAEVAFQEGRPLEGAAFYRALGREDLARSYESRGGARVALAVAGFAALVTGAIVLASAKPETQCDPPPKNIFQPPPVCRTDWKEGTIAAGIGLALLGPVLPVVGAFAIHADPVGPAERQRLVDAFNSSLGHAAADGAPTRPRPAAIRFTATPTFSGSGAGLTVAAHF